MPSVRGLVAFRGSATISGMPWGRRPRDYDAPMDPAQLDSTAVANAEVRANGGEIIYRGPLRVDDPRWPTEAAARHRGLRINDLDDPDRGWVVLVFPDGSVRLNARVARARWFRPEPGA